MDFGLFVHIFSPALANGTAVGLYPERPYPDWSNGANAACCPFAELELQLELLEYDIDWDGLFIPYPLELELLLAAALDDDWRPNVGNLKFPNPVPVW